MTKQHILDEIKRIALANEGKSPGINTFYKITGLKEHDWKGKYWARWGDAIAEAGFTPDQLKVPYDEGFLIKKVIELARELGRFPVFAEMQMKTYQDMEFPSHNTYKTRFGSKKQLVTRVKEYCRQQGQYDDIILMCEQVSAKESDEEITEEQVDDSEEIGFVYLLKSGRSYKIGKTNSTGRRTYELSIQLPEKATKVHEIRTDDPTGIEAYWHKRFADKRRNGEWFELDAADISAFKRRLFM